MCASYGNLSANRRAATIIHEALPTASDSFLLLGAARASRDDPEGALQLYRRSLAIREARLPAGDERIEEAAACVSETLIGMGRRSEADRVLQRLHRVDVEADPGRPPGSGSGPD